MSYEFSHKDSSPIKEAKLKSLTNDKVGTASIDRHSKDVCKQGTTHRCFSWFELPDGTYALVLYRLDLTQLVYPGWPAEGARRRGDECILDDPRRGAEPQSAVVLAVEQVWWPSSDEVKRAPLLGRFWTDIEDLPSQIPCNPRIEEMIKA